MNRTRRSLTTVLGVLTALEVLAAVLGARITGDKKPPTGAIAGIALLAALTLVAIYGMQRSARWAPALIYITRGLDLVNNLLGAGDDPSATLEVIGAVTFVLSAAVIVVLFQSRRQTAKPGLAQGSTASLEG
jgi:hypothetical protein